MVIGDSVCWLCSLCVIIIVCNYNLIDCLCNNKSKLTCCSGKNASCYNYDRSDKYNLQLGRKVKCFCDEHCMRTRDCCRDYWIYCRANKTANCVLSNWNEWSSCSISCNNKAGVQERHRVILTAPMGGGRPCMPLVEVKVCLGQSKCPNHQSQKLKQKSAIKKISLVKLRDNDNWLKRSNNKSNSTVHLLPQIPLTSELYWKYNRYSNIRHRLPIQQQQQLLQQQEPHPFHRLSNINHLANNLYCAHYRLTYISPTCSQWKHLSNQERLYWMTPSQHMVVGQHICLSCYQNNVTNNVVGSGNNNYQCVNSGRSLTDLHNWQAIRSDNCFGYFKPVTIPTRCICQQGPLSYHVI